MTRKYNVTAFVGRPKKYSKSDFKDIINKVLSDKELAKKYQVSVGTIQGIRSAKSKQLKIPIKDWNKNQHYRDRPTPTGRFK